MQTKSSLFHPAQFAEQRESRAPLLGSRGKRVLLVTAITALIAFVFACGITSPTLARAVKLLLISLACLTILAALAVVIAYAIR